jgi:hypothetical protein
MASGEDEEDPPPPMPEHAEDPGGGHRPIPGVLPPVVAEKRDLRRIADSIHHKLTHTPKNKYCEACQQGKMVQSQMRRHAPTSLMLRPRLGAI